MPEDLNRHAATQFGVVTVLQAESCGYDAREIARLCRKGDWARPRNGIYLPRRAPDPKEVRGPGTSSMSPPQCSRSTPATR